MYNALRDFMTERLQVSIDECRNLLDRHGYMIEMHGDKNYRTMVVTKTGASMYWIQLTFVPDSLEKLTYLKELYLHSNQLTITDSLRHMTSTLIS